MRKNTFLKKTLALALGLMTTAAMSTAAFAADATFEDGVAHSNEITVKIEKNLKVTNPTLASVDGPGLTYNYTIAPETPSASNGGTTITDSNNKTGTVHAGPADGVTLTTASVSWPRGTAVDASASGADNIKNLVASVDLTKFGTTPGIYRYKLTEASVPENPASIGVTDADNEEVRYLDVYIENGDNGLKVAGYVIHTGETANGKPSQKKSFDASTFETKNITLKKVVTGNMGDKSHEFPFAGTVSDNGRYFYAKKGESPAADDANKIAGAANGSEISTTLAHNQMYYINGVSTVATVAYTETNNTADVYKTSITGGTESAASEVNQNGTKAMAATDIDEAGEVTFTNDRESISPTGVVLGYGAPLLVLIAGIGLIALRRKSKVA